MSAILILCQDKPEIDAPGSLHHIIIRGIKRKRIFGDDKDRDNFLERLGNITAETSTSCYAWILISKHRPHSLQQLLAGESLDRQSCNSLTWLKKWLARNNTGLNPSQQSALALPFQYRTSMIQGPPGTGKTHLLGWTLIALIMQAHEERRPLRIGVSALTHQAIDTVLKKVTSLVNQYLPGIFPGHCIKWGQAGHSEKTEANEKIDKKTADQLIYNMVSDFLKKNNEFAIKEVFDTDTFNENSIVVKEIVDLLSRYRIRYPRKQQHLSDFFEKLLTTGLKQESGQFFTPVPIARFIKKNYSSKIIQRRD